MRSGAASHAPVLHVAQRVHNLDGPNRRTAAVMPRPGRASEEQVRVRSEVLHANQLHVAGDFIRCCESQTAGQHYSGEAQFVHLYDALTEPRLYGALGSM